MYSLYNFDAQRLKLRRAAKIKAKMSKMAGYILPSLESYFLKNWLAFLSVNSQKIKKILITLDLAITNACRLEVCHNPILVLTIKQTS